MHIHHGIYHRFSLLCFQLILNGQHLFGKCSQHMLWVCKLSFFFARFCSGSRHSVGCLLVKLPGGQHHEAFARAEILIAFSSRRSHEDLIKSYCTFSCFRFFMSQVLIHSVFFLEWNFLTPPHDSHMRQAAKDHCQSDADLVARLKAFQSHFHLFPSFWLMKMLFPVRLKWLQGDYDCMEVSRRIWCFFFDSTSRLFVSF